MPDQTPANIAAPGIAAPGRARAGGDPDCIAYETAILNEIRMMIDFVAANTDRKLEDFQFGTGDRTNRMSAGDVLIRLSDIEGRMRQHSAVIPADAALLQEVRDQLNPLVRPASSLTIGYTSLVTGNRRGPRSRETMARKAFEGLVPTAIRHRWTQRFILVMAVVVIALAVWVSARVALGRSLLQNLDALRTQQAALSIEKTRLEEQLDPPRKPGTPVTPDMLLEEPGKPRLAASAFFLCDRQTALVYYLSQQFPGTAFRPANPPKPAAGAPAGAADPDWLTVNATPQERDVCGRDRVLAVNFGIVHDALTVYMTDWTHLAGSEFELASDVLAWAKRHLLPAGEAARPANALHDQQRDVELLVAPVLLMWGNYILPVIFGLLGSLVFVILDFYSKLRTSMLDPRDSWLCVIRLVLGLVTGTCVGLFFSGVQIGPPVGAGVAAVSNLAASLTMSASGIAFLAGFGVEGVFSMLQSLVTRVFAAGGGK